MKAVLFFEDKSGKPSLKLVSEGANDRTLMDLLCASYQRVHGDSGNDHLVVPIADDVRFLTRGAERRLRAFAEVDDGRDAPSPSSLRAMRGATMAAINLFVDRAGGYASLSPGHRVELDQAARSPWLGIGDDIDALIAELRARDTRPPADLMSLPTLLTSGVSLARGSVYKVTGTWYGAPMDDAVACVGDDFQVISICGVGPNGEDIASQCDAANAVHDAMPDYHWSQHRGCQMFRIGRLYRGRVITASVRYWGSDLGGERLVMRAYDPARS